VSEIFAIFAIKTDIRMRKIIFGILCMVPMILFGQSFDTLWKQVEAARKKDLPQTEQETLRKIVVKAEKEKAYGQLLKAELQGARTQCEVSPDSLKPAVARLQQREQALKDPALKAVYQTVLGSVYNMNPSLSDDAQVRSKQYYDEALKDPAMLASVKSGDYKPFVEEGVDSRYYAGDLLSVIGYETQRYDVLRDYYSKTSNREAALMSSIALLSQQMPMEQEKYIGSSYLARIDSLINVYADLPEVGEAAILYYNYMRLHTDATPQQKWEYIEMALQRWGSWHRMNILRNKLNELKELTFLASGEEIILPQHPYVVKLKQMRSVSKMTMRVYQVKTTARELGRVYLRNKDGYQRVKPHLKAMPELTQTRQYEGKAPYEFYEDSLTLPALPVGIYMLEFESSPKSDNVERALLYVSGLRVLSQRLPDERMRYVVVDAITGQPVKGAQLRLRVRLDYVTLTTDAKGECEYKINGTRPSELYAFTTSDNACPDVYQSNWFSFREAQRVLSHTEIFLDRSIYRPGQKVHMAAILYQTEDGYKHSVEKGKTVKATLYDANHKEVVSQTLTTDDYGTCAADFTLPRQGLSGMYSVEVGVQGKYFSVEEYKRPTFEVEIPEVKENYADGDTLQVKGTARSYAGVPVQGATVTYKVERRRAYWWWRYSSYWNQVTIGEDTEDNIMMNGETVTDADGSFTIPTPLVMPKTRYPMFYNFVIVADVTDQAGETHHGELSLPLGNRKTALSIDVPEKVLAESNVGLLFHLRNAAGTDIEGEVSYRLTPEGKRSQDWLTVNTNKYVSLAKLKSGKYQVEAICGEDTVKQDFVVFSLDDKRPATETDDWFFVSHDYFPNDGTPVTLQVGSSAKDVHMVYTLLAGNTIVERGSVDKSNELVNRKLNYQESYGNGLTITYAWIKDGKTYHHEKSLRRPVPDSNLQLKWETFRNRLEPGQQEEWTLTIVGPDGKPCNTFSPDGKPFNAQLMATLYDKSLDQLVPHSWMLIPYLNLPMPSTTWNSRTWMMSSCFGSVTQKPLSYRELSFNKFDHSVYPAYYARPMFSGRRALGALAETKVLMVNERVVDEVVEVKEVSADAAFTGLDAENVDESLQGRIAGLDIVGGEGSLGSHAKRLTGSSQAAEGTVGEMAPQMRENLNETAFFYPQLQADSEGKVTIKFTLPESLTTWRFMGLAHTQDMKTGILADEVVAKKDVMIQPNLPRFVRQGDKASIAARIFNTGDKTISGKARLELLDPETMEVVYADEQHVEITANATIAVAFPYDCSHETRSLLVAKVMVIGSGFSDGEQHYLPILPNKERVTKTVPFTQNQPGTKTIDLNSLKPQTSNLNSQLTIEYTNNPAWLMIQALPVVGHPHDNCALCQAASFYANAIGRHILKQNPQAKSVFEAWSREQGSETSLMSSLQKNEELKDLILDETPWVADANREQEQKERLADFFDEALMEQRLATSLENLQELQQDDGSWSWWPGMTGSMYMTVEISEMLVRLNQMTTKQSDTREMLSDAFSFMGKEIVEMVREMKKDAKRGWTPTFPSHMALQWLYICTLDGRSLPANVQEANAYLIKLLKKETRNQSIYDKAMSAIVLNDKTYIKSLKEYTVYKEEMGRYYDTPRAFYSWRNFRIPTQVAAIEAIKRLTPNDKQTIEEMQRWLLQEKRNQAWDTPINSADAVYAFLNGNSEALKAQAKTVLKVDGNEIETSQATAGIGYVKTAMSGDDKKLFTAEKTSTGTSWGAVYMQYMQNTSEVEEQNSGISVKREMLSGDKHEVMSGQCHVGQRVIVRITIEADRDYDFVQVIDKRAACMEPVYQVSGYRWGYYTTPRDCSTNYYFDRLSKGKHVIETEYYIDRVGTYETGTCTASCAYSPEFRGVAKSQTIEVKD